MFTKQTTEHFFFMAQMLVNVERTERGLPTPVRIHPTEDKSMLFFRLAIINLRVARFAWSAVSMKRFENKLQFFRQSPSLEIYFIKFLRKFNLIYFYIFMCNFISVSVWRSTRLNFPRPTIVRRNESIHSSWTCLHSWPCDRPNSVKERIRKRRKRRDIYREREVYNIRYNITTIGRLYTYTRKERKRNINDLIER